MLNDVASTIHQSLAAGDCVGPDASGKYSKVRLVPADIRIESAWLQHLKLTYDELLSKIAFNFNLRPCTQATAVNEDSSSGKAKVDINVYNDAMCTDSSLLMNSCE